MIMDYFNSVIGGCQADKKRKDDYHYDYVVARKLFHVKHFLLLKEV